MHYVNGPLRPIFLAAVTAAALCVATPLRADPVTSPVTVVVVRHAEKADDGTRDPDLTEAGRERARALADALAETDIAAIYASQYRRTRATAEPLATNRGLEVQVREITGENLATWFDDLNAELHERHAGRTVVVVGHSNTVPRLVHVLTGRPVPPMTETEYDTLYIVTSDDHGPGGYIRARYGLAIP